VYELEPDIGAGLFRAVNGVVVTKILISILLSVVGCMGGCRSKGGEACVIGSNAVHEILPFPSESTFLWGCMLCLWL
jgi:hypothetical protein